MEFRPPDSYPSASPFLVCIRIFCVYLVRFAIDIRTHVFSSGRERISAWRASTRDAIRCFIHFVHRRCCRWHRVRCFQFRALVSQPRPVEQQSGTNFGQGKSVHRTDRMILLAGMGLRDRGGGEYSGGQIEKASQTHSRNMITSPNGSVRLIPNNRK